MENLLVRLLWLSSFILLSIGCSAGDAAKPVLSQSDLGKTEVVSRALKTGVGSEARKKSDTLLSDANKAREQAINGKRSWGPAAKLYGESAIYNPRPLTLMGMTEALLHDVGASNKADTIKRAVLESSLKHYKSSIAADDILKELSTTQRTELQHSHDCIQEYLNNDKNVSGCPPLKWVGMVK